MFQPQIIIEKMSGFHNNSTETLDRLDKAGSYKDLSTVCIIPTRGMIPAKAVESWLRMITPMNQKFTRMFAIGMEVGNAYNSMIEFILSNPELSKWKYILTLEEDNLMPPDGLLKLYEAIEGGVDGNKYDVVQGLYWTKGEDSQPMIYGDIEKPGSFIPQKPMINTMHPCNGLGMGFNLWRLDLFKDEKLRKPWFKTCNGELNKDGIPEMATQDLYFFGDAAKHGYKFACDTRVRVGHVDTNGCIW